MRIFVEVTASVLHGNDDMRSFWLPVWEKRSGLKLAAALEKVRDECIEDLDVGTLAVSNSHFDYRWLVSKLGGLEERTRGSGTKTAIIAAALSWAFRDQQPSRAIREAANLLGSDTDTISSMSGAILGCVADNEPHEDILDRDYISQQARRLFYVSVGGGTDDFVYPDVMHWDPPQSQLEAVRQGVAVHSCETPRCGFMPRRRGAAQAAPL